MVSSWSSKNFLAFTLKDGGTILIEEPTIESESEALLNEIETLRSEFETYMKIRQAITSKKLQAYMYNIIPMFRYGNNLSLNY